MAFFLRKFGLSGQILCFSLPKLILDVSTTPIFVLIDQSANTRNDPSMCYTNNPTYYYSSLSGKVKTNATLNNKCCLVGYFLCMEFRASFVWFSFLDLKPYFPRLSLTFQLCLHKSIILGIFRCSDLKLIFLTLFPRLFYPNCTLYLEYFPLIYAPINILCSVAKGAITNRLLHIA